MLAGAALALKTRHTALEHAARQELTELALDELREACPVAGLRHRAQEGLQVLGDDLMEHGGLGVTGPVDCSLNQRPVSLRSRGPSYASDLKSLTGRPSPAT
jgi:hypothetical protein